MLQTDKAKAIYKVTDTHIYGFFDEHRYLSNFHFYPIVYEGIQYPSNENAYQALKTLDNEERIKISGLTPSGAKSRGRSISLRGDWHNDLPEEEIERLAFDGQRIIIQVRDKIMYELCIIKFSSPLLLDMLLKTGDKYLEETNWWKDDYWGVCNGKGLNKLGFILMKIREDAKQKLKEVS